MSLPVEFINWLLARSGAETSIFKLVVRGSTQFQSCVRRDSPFLDKSACAL